MKTVESVSLSFREGNSDKVYHVQLVRVDGGFEVLFQYGRRGSALTSGKKTAEPVSEETARKVFAKLVSEKVRKGYQPMESAGGSYTDLPVQEVLPGRIPMLLNEVSEADLHQLLRDPQWALTQKYDGRRCMLSVDPKSVIASNRKGQAVAIPTELAEAFRGYCKNAGMTQFLLDGELLGDVLMVFDVLEENYVDVRDSSYSWRLAELQKLGIPTTAPVAFTAEEKLIRLEELRKAEQEGVVLRHLDSRYTPGRPNSGGPALKYKFYATLTARVRQPHPTKRSVSLELLGDQGWVDVGNVTIPPNQDVPVKGSLVEIRYLYGYPNGSLYQPVYLGIREDLDDTDARLEQVKLKAENTH